MGTDNMMSMPTMRLVILLAAALALSACGDDPVDGDTSANGDEVVLLVRAEGMVQSLGIT